MDAVFRVINLSGIDPFAALMVSIGLTFVLWRVAAVERRIRRLENSLRFRDALVTVIRGSANSIRSRRRLSVMEQRLCDLSRRN